MVAPAPRRANYDDVLSAPDNMVAEIVDGELHLSPRPATGHAHTVTALTEEIGPPFRRGRGGPGGWKFLFEAELHLGADVLVPDIAGWRTTRMPRVVSRPFYTLAPDWVCEVLSPRTSKLDRHKKMPVYAREQVCHAWLIDPVDRVIEVHRLENGRWSMLASYTDDAVVRAEPFEAIELELAGLWAEPDPDAR